MHVSFNLVKQFGSYEQIVPQMLSNGTYDGMRRVIGRTFLFYILKKTNLIILYKTAKPMLKF